MPKKVNRYPGIYQRSGSTTWTADIRWTDDRGDAHQHKKAGFTSQKEAQKYKTKFLADINQGRTTGISGPYSRNSGRCLFLVLTVKCLSRCSEKCDDCAGGGLNA